MTTTTLSHIEFSLSDLRSRYNQALGQLQMKQQELDKKQSELIQVKKDIEVWQQVQLLFSKATEYARAQLTLRIEETVTAGLQAVFEDESKFLVSIKPTGGQPWAKWININNKGIPVDPEDGDGGGALDMNSLALRCSILEISRPRPEGGLFLDEPGKWIGGGKKPKSSGGAGSSSGSSGSELNETDMKRYIENMAEFLKVYLAKTGRQALVVTHIDKLMNKADVRYLAALNTDELSEVTRV